MRRPTLLRLLPAALLAAGPAAAESLACSFATSDGGPSIDAQLIPPGESWQLTVLGESFPAEPVAMPGAGVAHFVVAPVDPMAGAAALLSVFADSTAILTVHGDFLGPAAVTRTGTCMKEGD